MSLDEDILKLASLREEFAEIKSRRQQFLEDLKATDLFVHYDHLVQDIAVTENSIRWDAVTIFKDTGEKKPHEAVEVKEITKLDIDMLKALEYAKTELPQALTLDQKVFQKVIRALPEEKVPDCVKISKVPSAYIASNLSIYLKPELAKEEKPAMPF